MFAGRESNPDRARHAGELVAQAPDALFACPHFAVAAMQRETRTMPIVAVQAGDPVTAGFARVLRGPAAMSPGFVLFEATIGTKFLATAQGDRAADVTRVGVMHSRSSAWRGDFAAIEAVAGSFGVQVIPTLVRDAADIESALDIRARAEWRADPAAGQHVHDPSSRADHRFGGPPSPASSLFVPSVRRGRRSDLLRRRLR